MTFQPGHKKTGGRQKGTVSRDTDEVRKLAKKYGPAAIEKLNYLMENSQDDRAKVAAAKELLERSYGRTSQTLGIDPTQNGIRVTIVGDDAKL